MLAAIFSIENWSFFVSDDQDGPDTTQRRNDLKNIIIPAIEDVAARLNCPVIDMYSISTEIAGELFKTPSAQRKLGSTEAFSDSVHPGDKLYELMAEEAAKAISKSYK